MNGDQGRMSSVAKAGDAVKERDYRDDIVLYLRKQEFNSLMEKALNAWRQPKISLFFTFTVLFSVVLSLIQVAGDPTAVGRTVLVGIVIMTFYLGVVCGRCLRPRPSQEKLDELARETFKENEIINYIQQSKRIAHDFRSFEGSIAEAELAFDLVKPCIVDYQAMSQIERISRMVAARTSNKQIPLHEVRLGDGEVREFWTTLSCDQCGRSLQKSQIRAHCDYHGGLFCEDCASERTEAARVAGTPILCKSCAIAPNEGLNKPLKPRT